MIIYKGTSCETNLLLDNSEGGHWQDIWSRDESTRFEANKHSIQMLEDESARFLLYGSRHIPESCQNQSFNLTVSSFIYFYCKGPKASYF